MNFTTNSKRETYNYWNTHAKQNKTNKKTKQYPRQVQCIDWVWTSGAADGEDFAVISTEIF